MKFDGALKPQQSAAVQGPPGQQSSIGVAVAINAKNTAVGLTNDYFNNNNKSKQKLNKSIKYKRNRSRNCGRISIEGDYNEVVAEGSHLSTAATTTTTNTKMSNKSIAATIARRAATVAATTTTTNGSTIKTPLTETDITRKKEELREIENIPAETALDLSGGQLSLKSRTKNTKLFEFEWLALIIGCLSKLFSGGLVYGKGVSRMQTMSAIRPWIVIVAAFAHCTLPLVLARADEADNFFSVNSFSVGPETTTPEFGKLLLGFINIIEETLHFLSVSNLDYASRGQKKFGDKCENTLECGFPGSICDSKKKSCQCTEDLPITNHFDKCGKGKVAFSFSVSL